MTRTIFILVISALLLSCSGVSQRPLLIKELKDIKAALASKDKEKIAGIFEFPVADTALNIYLDDTKYLEDLKKNGDKTTKPLFLKYFKKYYEYMGMEGMNRLFKYINVDGLMQKDSLFHEVRSVKEPCYTGYEVYVEKDMVTLTYRSNTNQNYSSKRAEDDEGFGDECEYAYIWEFRFDGKKLHFMRYMFAG